MKIDFDKSDIIYSANKHLNSKMIRCCIVVAMVLLDTSYGDMNNTENSNKNIDFFKSDDSLYRNKPVTLMLIFSSIGLTAVLRTVLKVCGLAVPNVLLILLATMLLGIVAELWPHFDQYTGIVKTHPRIIMAIVLPVLVFHIAFKLDAHCFIRAWLQIALLSVIGLLITTTFVGVIMTVIVNEQWTHAMAMLFGVICSPIYPIDVVSQLKDTTLSKHLVTLLEGEAMLGTGTAIVLFEITFGYINGVITTWYHLFIVLIRFVAGGKSILIN